MTRRLLTVLFSLLAVGVLAAPASAEVQRIKYRFGPLHVSPGQNTINIAPDEAAPRRPGLHHALQADLEYADGSVPGVEVSTCTTACGSSTARPRFAVGEEKTIVDLPDGYGYRYKPEQRWLINYMIHNLTQNPDTVYITYEIDFIPDTDPAAAGMKSVHTHWMDVAGPSALPGVRRQARDRRARAS